MVVPHLPDDQLLLLGQARSVALDAAAHRDHLAACPACQSRLAQLTAAEAHLRAVHAEDEWPGEARRARRRAQLQQAMIDAAEPLRLAAYLRRAPVAGGSLAAVVLLSVILIVSAIANRLGDRGAARVAGLRSAPGGAAERLHPRALPIRAITPGATLALAADELCRQMPWQPSPIPEVVREDVLRAYGMEQVPDHEYELDYLITPDLGGSPDPRNLWPEPYHSPVWNARVKDELESLLPRLVCEGKIDLQTAQRDIAVDWIAAYKKYFKTDRPLRQS